MDRKTLYYELAKIYTEEKMRQHNQEHYYCHGNYDSYARNIDLALNYMEEAVTGFAASEFSRSAEIQNVAENNQ